jgi:hypothetical protein
MGAPISKAFLIALADSLEDYGRETLIAFRAQDPADYARMFAHLIPKDASPHEIYSDAQLDRIYDALSENLAKVVQNGVATIH